MLTTHFPNSEVKQDLGAPTAALRNGRSDWRLAMRVITYRSVDCAIDTFVPCKSPGMDVIFFLPERQEVVIPYLLRI
jgi:hypothetical protein